MKTIHIDHAADIFHAHHGDKDAQKRVSILEMQEFISMENFSRFLEINQIVTFGDTERCPA